jgi:hypothetical protein
MMKKIKIIPVREESLFKINIDQSKLYIPEWYKKSPLKIKGLEKTTLIPTSTNTTTSTYKKCSPFLDALTNGYMFSLNQDIEVTIGDDGGPFIMWRTNMIEPISIHDNAQWDGLKYPENCHNFVYKWENHFNIKTPKGYSTLFTHPHNRYDLPFYTMSGIVETDKYEGPVHFPFFLKKDFVGIIKAGTPLAQITFIKREKWFRSIKKYNEENIKKYKFNFFSTIDRSYKNTIWQKKEYE